MYIPSDFFISSSVWLEAFPPDRPFSLQHPCTFHVMAKEVPSYLPNNAVLDPPDADYLFSAKVKTRTGKTRMYGDKHDSTPNT
jgi:hypothetical protein